MILALTSFSPMLAVLGQQSRPQVPADPNREGANLKRTLDSIELRVQATERGQAEVAGEVKTIEVVSIVVGVLVAIGAVGSLFGLARSEVRAAEAHKYALTTAQASEARTLRAFDLAMQGETGAQARAGQVHEAFLAGSRETLNLVNATLTLSNEASERAAHSQEERLAESLSSLDGEAQDLLSHVREIDSRTLLRDQTLLERLKTLADGLNNYEASRLYLPRVPKLTSACQFARGMQFHVGQQFNEAVKCWRTVVHDRDADEQYRALALYWTGYEQQSLGQFSEAANSYANAESLVLEVPRFELKRLSLEMQFFTEQDDALDAVTNGLGSLISEMEAYRPSDELARRISRARLTYGNVLHVFATSYLNKGDIANATLRFGQAIEQFTKSEQQEQYSRFGLAEAMFQIGNVADSADRFKNSVREDMRQEALKRPEPRTKVLALSIELIACMRVPQWGAEVPLLMHDVIGELGDVNARLWVYSPIRRRPMLKSEFQRDLERYVAAANVPAGPAGS